MDDIVQHVVGHVIGVQFSPGTPEIKIKSDDGQSISGIAKDIHIDKAIQFRSLRIQALFIVQDGKNRLLWIKHAAEIIDTRTEEERTDSIFAQWDELLRRLARDWPDESTINPPRPNCRASCLGNAETASILGETMNYKVIFEPQEEGGYTVFVPSLPGCISEGDTYEEAMVNIRDAIALYIESLIVDGLPIPKETRIITEIEVPV